MSSQKSIVLRFESRNGQFRLTVKPSDHFPSLLSKVNTRLSDSSVSTCYGDTHAVQQILDNLPKDVDSRSITLTNKPVGGEDRLLSSLKGITIDRVGLRYLPQNSNYGIQS